MKTFFISLTSVTLCSGSLLAYSNIPEVMNLSSNYSSISSYPKNNSSSNNKGEVLESEQIPINESEAVAANSEAANENTGLIPEATSAEENMPTMMASGPWTYSGILKVDDDGSGPSHNDPNHNPHTWWQPNGKDLNADLDSYVVVPSWLAPYGVKPGDRADVYFRIDMDSWNQSIHQLFYISSKVGDKGPATDNPGEISVKAVRDLGCGILETSNGPIPTWPYSGSTSNISVWVTYYPSGP